ncbi:phosphate ABC transporter permease subunit PstC [Marinicellulosiphila megalodicopiae]|uniref:phosphate ABC transporter permease subunit PstC n=1 Tax=Marinicellulosiphila megalodicopiae TaxID=2724896 RepID=UPI003BAF5A99
MSSSTLVLALIIFCALYYVFGRMRAIQIAGPIGGIRFLPSLPNYYGFFAVILCAVPAVIFMLFWLIFVDMFIQSKVLMHFGKEVMVNGELALVASDQNFWHLLRTANTTDQNLIISKIQVADIMTTPPAYLLEANEYFKQLTDKAMNIKSSLFITIALLCGAVGIFVITPKFNSRNRVEKVILTFFFVSSILAILTTVGIIYAVLRESYHFFKLVPITEFLFSTEWSPQTALRADQQASSGAFGAIPLITGTLLISFLALLISIPFGLFSAIYLSEYANYKVRSIVKPLLEVLAGIPTVVYGFFAALTMAPFIRDTAQSMGFTNVSSESALAAGIVMGIMIIPIICSLTDDIISAVPQSLRDGSSGLGATKSETIRKVVLPAALPGIVSSIILAASRAIGETMIVVMAVGTAANLTANPLESVTTVTVQIVMLLTGDQEFDSAKTLSAFALALLLFTVTLGMNFFANHIVKKYREQYD